MALSVSGFPEPSRSNAESGSDSSPSESLQEGHKGLMNRPRLRCLFGRRPESKTASFNHFEVDDHITPPSPPPPSLPSPTFMPSPNLDQTFQVQMASRPTHASPTLPQRTHILLPTPRKTPPPVILQPSLSRLEIGKGRKPPAAHPLHTPPKPPTVIVQEWSAKSNQESITPPRPLPATPETCTPLKLVVNPQTIPKPVTQTRSPPSRVILSSATRPRGQTQTTSVVSVRYLPLAVDRQPESNAVNPDSRVRPLPHPPSTLSHDQSPSASTRFVPRPARVKRPKTSPASYSLDLGPRARSGFDAIPSSWAAVPADLHRPTPVRQSPIISSKAPCLRSKSRQRQNPSSQSPPHQGFPASAPHTPPSRSPTQTPISFARPNVRQASLPLSPPQQPMYSPEVAPKVPQEFLAGPSNRCLPTLDISGPKPRPLSDEISEISEADSTAPLHSHPMYPFSEDDSTNPADSPLATSQAGWADAFVDDLDASHVSRSPSPMRYARRSSRGSLSEEYPPLSASPEPKTWTQLRSYRNSYRRRQSPDRALSRSPSPIHYARRPSLDRHEDAAMFSDDAAPKRHVLPRSFQFEHVPSKDSPPFTRNTSLERKAGSNHSGSTEHAHGYRLPRSRSSRQLRPVSAVGSVLDISLPTISSPVELNAEQPPPELHPSQLLRSSQSVPRLQSLVSPKKRHTYGTSFDSGDGRRSRSLGRRTTAAARVPDTRKVNRKAVLDDDDGEDKWADDGVQQLPPYGSGEEIVVRTLRASDIWGVRPVAEIVPKRRLRVINH